MRRDGRWSLGRLLMRTVPRAVALSLSLALAWALAGCSSLPRAPSAPPEAVREAARYREAGLAHYRHGRFARAEVFFARALAASAAVDHRPGVVEMLAALGRARLAQDDPDGAEVLFGEALAACRGLVRPDLEAEARGGFAAAALWRGDALAARDWLAGALALPLADPGHARAVLLHDLGAAERLLGDDVAAAGLLSRALAMHEELQDRAGIATACHSLAALLGDAGDLDAALRLAHRALLLDKALGLPRAVAQDLALLGRLTETAGNAEQARHYFRRADLAWRALGERDEPGELPACAGAADTASGEVQTSVRNSSANVR